jgi:hypothetical protein
MLKRFGCTLFFIVLFPFVGFAQSQNSKTADLEMQSKTYFEFEKVYCSPDQIEMTSQVIYVHLGDNSFEIDQLQVDQGGIYFTLPHARCPFTRKTINPKTTCVFNARFSD